MNKSLVFILVLCLILWFTFSAMSMDNLHRKEVYGDVYDKSFALTLIDTQPTDITPLLRIQSEFKIDSGFNFTAPRISGFTINQPNDVNGASYSTDKRKRPDVYKREDTGKLPMGVAGVMFYYDTHLPAKDFTQKVFYAHPYFDINLARGKITGEAKYQWGSITDRTTDHTNTDVSRFAANVEFNMPLGPVYMTTGYVYLGSASDYYASNIDTNQQTFFIGGAGGNWDKIWILTGNDTVNAKSIGGTDDMNNAQIYGCKIIYLGASLSPVENLDIGILMAASSAENVPKGEKGLQGLKWDVSLSYQLFDNLSYDFIAAFLAAGDFWKGLDPNLNVDTSFSLYQQVKLKF